MSLKGSLESFHFATILQLLCSESKTGVVQVQNGPYKIKIIFNQGSIIYAQEMGKKDRLSQLLIKNGIISSEQLKECLIKAREKKLPLGSHLVEKGFISRETLVRFVSIQVEEILYEPFLWEKGVFEYKSAGLDLNGMVAVNLNVMKIILEGSRRIDEMSILKKLIPNDKLIFKASAKGGQGSLNLNSNEWRMLSLNDGTRTVKEVVQKSGYDEFAVYRLINSLNASGLIEKLEDTPFEKKAEVTDRNDDYAGIIAMYNDILHVIRKNLEPVLGEKTFVFLEECKPTASTMQKKLLHNFDPQKSASYNIKNVIQYMQRFNDFEEGYKFLINSFNEFCLNLLNKLGGVLDKKMSHNLVIELKNVLMDSYKYQMGGAQSKKRVIKDIRTTVRNGLKIMS
ncbi:DUF4388 domain-containing protein [Desulfococcaceae bacterium HSG7]|nr:DUF4388 domain-containing protein [Desulfococcaceae bacterium HSG9]MDM8554758.1 DUF4388 domain-containing protein [Desulfococcaceae bacterium HSG7]